MTADTPAPDHARALEVLGNITPGDWHVGGVNGLCQTTVRAELGERVALVDEQFGTCGDFNARAIAAVPEFKALYAAAVRREEIGNGLDDMDIHSPEYKAFEQAWRDARRAYREALAAVAKAVLP